MSKKPATHRTIEELKKTIARKIGAAKKYQLGPERQKLLREARRYRKLLKTKESVGLHPPTQGFHSAS